MGPLQVFKFNLYSRLKIALVVYLYIKIANDLKMYLFIYNNIYTSYLFIPEFVQLCSHFVNEKRKKGVKREREGEKELPQVILCLLFRPVTQKKYKYYVTWRKNMNDEHSLAWVRSGTWCVCTGYEPVELATPLPFSIA